VLPSFRNRLSVVLCIDHIAVRKTGRGWRPHSAPALVQAVVPEKGEPSWQAPLSALRACLEDMDIAGANIDIALADDFVRYAVTPWSEQIQGADELAAMTRIQFESLFGPAALDWEYQVEQGEYRKPAIACAIDASLMAALRELCSQWRFRMVALQPGFMRAFNRVHAKVADDALFVVAGPAVCVLGTRVAGAWQSMRTVHLHGGPAGQQLAVLVEREILLQGLPPDAPIYVHGAALADAETLRTRPHIDLLQANEDGARAGVAILEPV
jgi:hypothetical protein